MQIHWSKLNHLPVFTESAVSLGRICDAVFDVESLALTHIVVKHGIITHRSLLLIHHSHIVSVSEEKMIVRDAAEKMKDEKHQTQHIPSTVFPSRTHDV